jgi:predicted Zn-dependent protease
MKGVLSALARAVLVSLCLAVNGCASAPILPIGAGDLPASLQQQEEKILSDIRREIELLEEKGAIYNDPALEVYLQEIGERMIPQERRQGPVTFRFRMVRDPTLNAFAYPTGDIFVHTGLLARLRSEGEIADVLGHEASHVYSRDTLYRFADTSQKTIAWKVTDLLLTPALSAFGAGGLGEQTLSLIYATSVTGYGREQEARSDLDGLGQMLAAGYDPYEGVRAEERFLAEEEKYRKGPEIFFLASHPNTRWRKEAKERWLRSNGIEPRPSADDPNYLTMTVNLRKENARLNLQMGRTHHALDDLHPISQGGTEEAEVWILIGEAYRRMANDPAGVREELNPKAWKEIAFLKEEQLKEQWREKAEEAYRRTLDLHLESPEAHRGLGLLWADRAIASPAIEHLERYLQLSPQARDRRFITSQLERLEKHPDERRQLP